MNRRDFLTVLTSALLGVSRDVGAQKAGNDALPTILTVNVGGVRGVTVSGFQRGLRQLGYSSANHRLVIVSLNQVPDFSQELARHQVDVIFASSPAGVRAAREAAKTAPIVALDLETDPVAAGWIGSFARPGGNLTGLFLDQPALAAKWLQLIKEAVAAATRIAVLWDPATGTGQLAAVEAAARTLTLGLQIFEFLGPDLDRVLAKVTTAGSHAMVVLSSPQVIYHRAQLAELLLKARLPSISMFRQFAEAGGLVAYGADPGLMAERAAAFVDKILKGQKPGDIPIEQPSKLDLVVNLKTARALGITIPQSILLRADEVIE